jgi:hypothetical protein
MAGYVAEVYLSRLDAATLGDLSTRLRQASEELSRGGAPVVYVRSVFLPEDETCFHFFEAPSAEVIRECCSLLDLARPRITTATSEE